MIRYKSVSVSAAFLGLLMLVPDPAWSQQRWPGMPEITVEIRKERSIFVPMRDGVRLSTDLYFPQGVEGELPVILVRTPYNKEFTYPYGGMIPLLVQPGVRR